MFLRIDTISVTLSYDFFFGACVTDIVDYVAMPELMRSLPEKPEKIKKTMCVYTYKNKNE